MEPQQQQKEQTGNVDMHHRAFFSFEPSLFLADLGNIALDYCIAGIHQLERAIHESPLFQHQTDGSLAPNCPEVQQQINQQLQQFKAAASQVLGEVQRRMADNVNRAAENFERYEAVTNLHVPAELYVQQPLPAMLPGESLDEQQEAQLDAELAQLRNGVQQVRSECRQLKQQLVHMDLDISQAAARAGAFKPLTDVVNANSQQLLEEAAAINSVVGKLQPMMQQAQQLQQQQQQQQEHEDSENDPTLASVLAAAAAAAGVGGGGGNRARQQRGKGGADGKASGGAAAGAGSVEQQVRQLMAETGAGLAALARVNATLANSGE